MENISELVGVLKSKAQHCRSHSLIFHFEFKGKFFQCIFFGIPGILTIAVKDLNAGWQIDLSEGKLSNWIPPEVYTHIKEILKNNNDVYSNVEFFEYLKGVLETLSEKEDFSEPTKKEILEIIGMTKTSDKKYGSDGNKPFFDHWRRVVPSNENLNKIKDHFGNSIRNLCQKNKVTAVWSAVPKDNSLMFLNPVNTQNQIISIK